MYHEVALEHLRQANTQLRRRVHELTREVDTGLPRYEPTPPEVLTVPQLQQIHYRPVARGTIFSSPQPGVLAVVLRTTNHGLEREGQIFSVDYSVDAVELVDKKARLEYLAYIHRTVVVPELAKLY